jgi:hypothetical protein
VTTPAPSLTLPRFVQRGRAESVTLALYNPDESPAAVTAGTYTLLDHGGAEVVTGAITVPGGVPTFDLPSTFADGHGLPQPYAWRERWALTGVSGTALDLTLEQQVHVCRVAPASYINVGHLYAMHSEWRRQLPQSSISPAEKIGVAWEEMIGRLLGDGHLPSKVLNWWALSVVHKYWSASLVAGGFETDAPNDSRWARKREEYRKRADDEYEHHFKIQADRDDDGVADDPATLEAAEPQLFLTDIPAIGPCWRPTW